MADTDAVGVISDSADGSTVGVGEISAATVGVISSLAEGATVGVGEISAAAMGVLVVLTVSIDSTDRNVGVAGG